jgi:hypothetical protein
MLPFGRISEIKIDRLGWLINWLIEVWLKPGTKMLLHEEY